MKGMWVARMTLKGLCNLRIQCSRSNGNQGTGPPAKYSQLFEMEIRLFQFQNQIKASIQGVSRQRLSLFEAAHKEGSVLFPGWSRISLSLFPSLLLAPAGLEWCRASNQTVAGCAKSLTSPCLLPLLLQPMTACPDIDGTWDWFKMTGSSSLRKRRLIQRSSQTSFSSLQE